jgi:erythromycin esterase-like protein
LKESSITLSGDYFNQRDYNMWKRTDTIVQLYLNKADKAVIYAHTEHTNKFSSFNQHILKFSLGRYLSDEYKEQFYSIALQAGEGYYTQDSTISVGKTMTDKLKLPPNHSLEQTCLKTNLDYFFYPANKLPDDILSLRVIHRESRNTNHFHFCYLPKRFDAFVFIKQSHELKFVEKYPAFSDSHMGKMRGQLNSLLKELEK